MRYVKVALNLPLDQLFRYKVPQKLAAQIKVGKRVLVPFKRRKLVGFVVEEAKEEDFEGLKEVISIVDEFSPLEDDLFRLGRWISDYYCSPLGQTLHAIVSIQYPFKADKGATTRRHLSSYKDVEELPSFLKEEKVVLFQTENWQERTDLYLELIEKVLSRGKQVILIVPEVSYIPFLKRKIQAHYKNGLSIFHSRLTPKQRYLEWQRMRRGDIELVIGTRSAVFAPFPNPGLIIIEEEESLSHKQREIPRYHTREVAIKRGKIQNFPVVLVSQSPSMESWWQARKGNYKLVEISRGKDNFPLVEIVDLRKEKDRLFSTSLKRSIEKTLKEGELTLLFLNRRGFANFLLCRECGEVLRCPNCNIGLTFHLKGRLICHYCGYEEDAPRICPSCKGRHLYQVGVGTEQLEMEARKKFPEARIRRADLDIIDTSLAYRKLLDELGKIDLLIGTGLIIKEEILQRAKLVGVVLLDNLLNLPDFRAGEWTFQVLTKIRNLIKKEGRLIIQTYNPTHYALTAIREGRGELFYEKEMDLREELGYPPHLHWTRILLEGRSKGKVEEVAERIRKELEVERVNFLGPSSCPFGRIKRRYRYHLILRDKDPARIREILKRKLYLLFKHFHNVKVIIDVDPLRTM